MDIFDLADDKKAMARYERARTVMFGASFATFGILIAASVLGPVWGWPLLWVGGFGFSIAALAMLYFWSELRERWAIVQTSAIGLSFLSVLFNLGVHNQHPLRGASLLLSLAFLIGAVWVSYVATKMCQQQTKVVQAKADAIVREALRKASERLRRDEP